MAKAVLEWSAKIIAEPGAGIVEMPAVSVRTTFTPGELPLEEILRMATARFAQELLLATGIGKADAIGLIQSHLVNVSFVKVDNA